MVISEVYTVIKICRDIVNWADKENSQLNEKLDEIPEINIMEARKKFKELKKAIKTVENKG